jgi:hypothetical protein
MQGAGVPPAARGRFEGHFTTMARAQLQHHHTLVREWTRVSGFGFGPRRSRAPSASRLSLGVCMLGMP